MKEIPLTQGKVAIVDDEDFGMINCRKWLYSGDYAARFAVKDRKERKVWMHREIMKSPANMQVDHINGNKLDNRKVNLRICTPCDNMHNQGMHKNNKSGYKGVSWQTETGKWHVQIAVNRKIIYLGNFDSLPDAAIAYNEAAKKYHGKFARLNEVKNG